jgi:hypothetical protein
VHVCVTYKPHSAPPPEMLPMMIDGTRQWIDHYGDKFETLWWFAQGGGVGVMEASDEVDLMRMMAEHPFTPYCDVDVQVCVDPRTGVDTFGTVVQERVAAMQAAG